MNIENVEKYLKNTCEKLKEIFPSDEFNFIRETDHITTFGEPFFRLYKNGSKVDFSISYDLVFSIMAVVGVSNIENELVACVRNSYHNFK